MPRNVWKEGLIQALGEEGKALRWVATAEADIPLAWELRGYGAKVESEVMGRWREALEKMNKCIEIGEGGNEAGKTLGAVWARLRGRKEGKEENREMAGSRGDNMTF